jgi:tetratricopeptide (TPR) repeat protein
VNLLYWKELESLTDVEKSNFYQKLGICYYNMRDNGRALQYFERAFYYDKENEILKHWIRLLKNEKN